MPLVIRKLPKKDLYKVYNKETKKVHSYATTLENAKKQVSLLESKEISGGTLSQNEKVKLANEIKPITEEKAIKSYLDLADETSIPPTTSNKGNNFVDYFTFLERLETTGKKGITFWEFWNSKSEYMKKKYTKNFLEFMKKSGSNSLVKNLYQLFKMYFGAVSIFKPVIAMSIYHKYKPTSVLDFTMGWGGRLVGAAALDVPKYTGIDLNKNLEKPYREMEKTLKELGTKTDIKLIFKDALQVDYSKLDYDMVFTSPPYYNVELYRGTNKMTEEDWNEKFYRPLFTETYKYLKTGGYYILNVPISVYENILVKLFGKADKLIPMNTSRRPMSEKRKQVAVYKEYIYVWNKKEKRGAGIETDNFKSDGIVSLPEFRSVKIDLPTYMFKRLPDIKGNPPPYRYRLVVPITSSRNISSRKQETSLNINQKSVANPIVNIEQPNYQPRIEEFSPADRQKIQDYYYRLEQNENRNPDEIDKDAYVIKPRGKPLPCNNAKPKQPKPPKEKKPIGRPKKPKPEEPKQEDLFAKLMTKENISKIPSRTPSVTSKKSKLSSLSSFSAIPNVIKNNEDEDIDLDAKTEKSGKTSKSSKSSGSSSSSEVRTTSIASSKESKSSKASSKASEVSLTDSELADLWINDRNAFREYMRKKQGKGLKNIISSNNNNMPNSWISYVKEYASKNGMSYRDALRDPKCKAGYKKTSKKVVTGMGVIDESEFADQALLADAYNSNELGANAGKKYISL